jgi:hypothetical protein
MCLGRTSLFKNRCGPDSAPPSTGLYFMASNVSVATPVMSPNPESDEESECANKRGWSQVARLHSGQFENPVGTIIAVLFSKSNYVAQEAFVAPGRRRPT